MTNKALPRFQNNTLIKTGRLILVLLNQDQIQILVKSMSRFDQTFNTDMLNLRITSGYTDDFWSEIHCHLEKEYNKNANDLNPDLFFWLIFKKDLKLAGGVLFHDLDTISGKNCTACITYFTDDQYRKQGLTRESLRNLIPYVFQNTPVSSLFAEVPFNHHDSINTLKALHFEQTDQRDGILHWKLDSSPEGSKLT
jgi:RimJ/RimL family protein N-acetyltransferase